MGYYQYSFKVQREKDITFRSGRQRQAYLYHEATDLVFKIIDYKGKPLRVPSVNGTIEVVMEEQLPASVLEQLARVGYKVNSVSERV